MPRNNSRKRKDERSEAAALREKTSQYHGDCGHWHNQNGHQNCPYRDQPLGLEKR